MHYFGRLRQPIYPANKICHVRSCWLGINNVCVCVTVCVRVCVRTCVYFLVPIARVLSYRLEINVCVGLRILVSSWRSVVRSYRLGIIVRACILALSLRSVMRGLAGLESKCVCILVPS